MTTRRAKAGWIGAGALVASAAAWGVSEAGEGPAVAEKKPAIADLSWLEGKWRHAEGESVFDEQWLAPEGDAMAAVSRSVEHGKTGMYELSSIETGANGLVLRIRHFGPALVPWKSEGAESPAWPLARVGDREAVFEAPEKDFPRRIVYRRETPSGGADVLVAKLEGERGGKPKELEFRLTLVR